MDSDFDYLLQGKTDTSKRINENPYIFQTYSYSIENLQCYSPSLHTACVKATKNDTHLIDIEKLLIDYSVIIYDLFIWTVYLYSIHNVDTFSITAFCDEIKILNQSHTSYDFQLSLSDLQQKVSIATENLQLQFPEAEASIISLKQELSLLGLTPENTYLFAQGHTIFDNVVVIFLRSICFEMKKQREAEIKNLSQGKEIANAINEYHNACIDIKTVLQLNTDFDHCFLFQKLKADLVHYIKQFRNYQLAK